MNIEQAALQVLENMVCDLMYAFELDRELAERVAITALNHPQMAIELEQAVKNKRALGK